jgi:hypothetical protein
LVEEEEAVVEEEAEEVEVEEVEVGEDGEGVVEVVDGIEIVGGEEEVILTDFHTEDLMGIMERPLQIVKLSI